MVARSAAGASNVFLVQSDGVEIDHLKVDGDNPTLTSGESIGGADIDARNGIITNHRAGVYNNLSIHNVTVKNVFLRGIYASSGGTFNISTNVVDNVQGQSAGSIGIFNFPRCRIISGNLVSNADDGISANHSTGTTFTRQQVTASGSGVHTDNAGDSGGARTRSAETTFQHARRTATACGHLSPTCRRRSAATP